MHYYYFQKHIEDITNKNEKCTCAFPLCSSKMYINKISNFCYSKEPIFQSNIHTFLEAVLAELRMVPRKLWEKVATSDCQEILLCPRDTWQ